MLVLRAQKGPPRTEGGFRQSLKDLAKKPDLHVLRLASLKTVILKSEAMKNLGLNSHTGTPPYPRPFASLRVT